MTGPIHDPEVEAFLAVSAARLAPRTVEAYRRDLAQLAAWRQGEDRAEAYQHLRGIALTLASPLATVIVGLAIMTFGFFGAHSVASSWVGVRAQSEHRLEEQE